MLIALVVCLHSPVSPASSNGGSIGGDSPPSGTVCVACFINPASTPLTASFRLPGLGGGAVSLAQHKLALAMALAARPRFGSAGGSPVRFVAILACFSILGLTVRLHSIFPVAALLRRAAVAMRPSRPNSSHRLPPLPHPRPLLLPHQPPQRRPRPLPALLLVCACSAQLTVVMLCRPRPLFAL